MVLITDLRVHDIRFPTSEGMHGSDAVHPDPDYSAAYVVLHTDAADLQGHGMTFTIGRGTEIVKVAVEAFRVRVTDLTIKTC
jgi:L-fuconate dehydratase